MVLGDLNNDTNINLLDLVLLASYLDLDDSGNHYFPEMYNSINESSAISNISGIDGIRGIDENDLDFFANYIAGNIDELLDYIPEPEPQPEPEPEKKQSLKQENTKEPITH